MFCDFVQYAHSVDSFLSLCDCAEWEIGYEIEFLLGTDYSTNNEWKL
jgi:hypothetical protein